MNKIESHQFTAVSVSSLSNTQIGEVRVGVGVHPHAKLWLSEAFLARCHVAGIVPGGDGGSGGRPCMTRNRNIARA